MLVSVECTSRKSSRRHVLWLLDRVPSPTLFQTLPTVKSETASTQTTVAVATREAQTESALRFATPLEELAAKVRALDFYVVPVASLSGSKHQL